MGTVLPHHNINNINNKNNNKVPFLSPLSLAVDVQVQMAASNDTVIQSERVLQNTEAILSAESPRETINNDAQPIIPIPTPQQTAEHSAAVHNDITYAKHYLAQTQERLQHSNNQDPIEDPLQESLFNPKKILNNENVADSDGVLLAGESVGHTTGVLSKSVQEQIKASKSMMQRSEAMMDSMLKTKSLPTSTSRPNSPSPSPSPSPSSLSQPPTLAPPTSFRRSPSPLIPPSRSPLPPPISNTNKNNNNNINNINNNSESGDEDDISHLRKIYHGKNARPPSASLDKIMSYPNPSSPQRYTPPPPLIPSKLDNNSINNINNNDSSVNSNIDNKNNNNNNNKNYPKSTSPIPASPTSGRPSSSLSKPHLSMPPPLLYPPSSSPTFFSYTPSNRGTTPEPPKYGNSKTTNMTPSRTSRPASPSSSVYPSTSLSSSSHLPSSTPASAARSLLFTSPPPSRYNNNVRGSSPSLPVSELSRLDLSTPPPMNPNPYSSTYQSSIPKTYSSSFTPNSSSLYSSHPSSSSFSNSANHTPIRAFTPSTSSSSHNNITVALVSALSSKEREEYVERIKERNKSASLSGDSLLDRFFTERSYTT